ncbi:MAG: hypothetical protein ABIO04_00295 [Ferruginibacter sp.]
MISYKKFSWLLLVIIICCSCSKDAADNSSNSASTGVAGSLSKFTIVGNYLYAVDNHYLYSYDITDPYNPVNTNTSDMNLDIETIYPFNNRLFIGTRTGLYIYSIDTPSIPSRISEAHHARSCDPVVANDSVAFVTLKGNSDCGPAESGLYIHDIRNIFQPLLIKKVLINSPQGLGLHGNALYVCCNNEGLKVYNVLDPANPVIIRTITGGFFIDVIPFGDLLICYMETGLNLYDISNPMNPTLLTFIAN